LAEILRTVTRTNGDKSKSENTREKILFRKTEGKKNKSENNT